MKLRSTFVLTVWCTLIMPSLGWGLAAQSFREVLVPRSLENLYIFGETTGKYGGLPILAARPEELKDASDDEQIAVYRERANAVCTTWGYLGAADYTVRPVESVNKLPVFENGRVTVETIRPVVTDYALSIVTTYLFASPIWQNPRVFDGLTCYRAR